MTTREKKTRQLNLRVTETTIKALESQRGNQYQSDYITALILRDGRKTKPIEAIDPLIWRAIVQAVGPDGAALFGATWAQMVGGDGDA